MVGAVVMDFLLFFLWDLMVGCPVVPLVPFSPLFRTDKTGKKVSPFACVLIVNRNTCVKECNKEELELGALSTTEKKERRMVQ